MKSITNFLSAALLAAASAGLAAPALAQQDTELPSPTDSERSFLENHFKMVHCLDYYYYHEHREQITFDGATTICHDVLDIPEENYGKNMDAFIEKYGHSTARGIAKKLYLELNFEEEYQPPVYPSPQ